MPCEVITKPNGVYAIINRAAAKPEPCPFCRERPAVKLCDFRVAVGDVGHTRTCDAAMCVRCAKPVRPNVDFCPDHASRAS
jgi:hypothetical protein